MFITKKEISLIIGAVYKDLNILKKLLSQLDNNIDYLKEILCIVSGVNTPAKMNELEILKKIIKKEIQVITFKEIIMPGQARNIGIIKSKYEFICFLDCHTLPNKNWLKNSIKILEENNLKGVLGRCKYIGLNEFENCFIAASYGYNPLFTVPGTLIEKSLLYQIGLFIPNKRTGEDSEWMNRSKSFDTKLRQSNVLPVIYRGLKVKNRYELIKKWFLSYKLVYYSQSYNLQRTFYITYISIFLILVGFSWNDKVANWDENSILYAPHISKIIILLITFSYLLYRLFLLPISKKVNIFKFNLIQFLEFSLMSILLDFVKLIAFINRNK